MDKGKLYFNGKFQTSLQQGWLPNTDPSTGEKIGEYALAHCDEVDEAVDVAHKAFETWRHTSRFSRGDYIDRLIQVTRARRDQIAKAISRDTGKSLNESHAEITESIHAAQYTFGNARMPSGDIISSELAERDMYTIRKPKGVVAIIAPWNFPLAIGGYWCAAPAIAEGNTVVFKPSEDSPLVGQIIAELYHEAGFPAGVFNMVQGDGKTGSRLAHHSKVAHICFTGSVTVGQHIRRICAESVSKTCSCEMGSKSACMIFADGDYNLGLAAAINSAFKLSGQRCVSSGRILIERPIYDRFCRDFTDLASKVTVGSPFAEGNKPFMGPLINAAQRDRVERYNGLTVADPDVTVLLAGHRIEPGFFMTPHVYKCEWADKPFLRDEVFGPHVALIPFDGADEAIKIYNDTPFGLAVGVVTSDFKKARYVRDRADFGLGYWNSGSISAESHNVFGGVKASGYGWPSAAGTVDAVTHKIAWSVNHGDLTFPQGLK